MCVCVQCALCVNVCGVHGRHGRGATTQVCVFCMQLIWVYVCVSHMEQQCRCAYALRVLCVCLKL
jgi:hypothetical protein